jgi:hypothetical protein
MYSSRPVMDANSDTRCPPEGLVTQAQNPGGSKAGAGIGSLLAGPGLAEAAARPRATDGGVRAALGG